MGKYSGYLIASDFDKTLTPPFDEISAENREAIHRFRKEGGIFSIVSGRCLPHAKRVFIGFMKGEFDYLILCNGALAFDGEKIIFQYYASSKGLHELLNHADEFGVNDILYLSEDDQYLIDVDGSHETDPLNYVNKNLVPKCDSFNQFTIIFKSGEEYVSKMQKLLPFLEQWFNVYRSHANADVCPKGISKTSGINKLADILGIETDKIYTVGDGYNDIPMIEAFHGCAMESGIDELKQKAQYTVKSVADVISIIDINIDNKTQSNKGAENGF